MPTSALVLKCPQCSPLSIEIVELIATFIGPADLSPLRLVCREINEKTLEIFGRANFVTIQTDLSHQSLQRIKNISESETFAKLVRSLHVRPSPDGVIGQGLDWTGHFSGCLAEDLHSSHLLRILLSDRLPNCRSFLISNYDESESRRDTGRLVSSDVAGLLISIIAKANVAVRSFKIQNHVEGKGCLDTPGLQMPLSQTPAFVKSWSQVEELMLDSAITPDQLDWLLHLVSSTPKLRKLSLGFYKGDQMFMQLLSAFHTLYKLEELRLKSARVTVNALSSLLLRNSATLHSLSLQHIALGDYEGRWSTVFQNMKGHFPCLQNLVLFWLKQGTYTDGLFIFSMLLKYPVSPGSEVRGPNDCLKYESPQIDSMEDPIRLRYWPIGQSVLGIEYHGKEIDQVLGALVITAGAN